MQQPYISKLAALGYSFILLVCLTTSACFNEPKFANTPQITFKGFSKYSLKEGKGVGQQKRDSLIITIGFKDGDGDLGNSTPISSQEESQYMQAGDWGNYKIRTFRLEDNQFKEIPSLVTNFMVFPRLIQEGKNSAIEGSLDFNLIYPYGKTPKNYPTKYRIQIRDRALNVSNEIETDTITIPHAY